MKTENIFSGLNVGILTVLLFAFFLALSPLFLRTGSAHPVRGEVNFLTPLLSSDTTKTGEGPLGLAIGACGSAVPGDVSQAMALYNDGPIYVKRGESGTATVFKRFFVSRDNGFIPLVQYSVGPTGIFDVNGNLPIGVTALYPQDNYILVRSSNTTTAGDGTVLEEYKPPTEDTLTLNTTPSTPLGEIKVNLQGVVQPFAVGIVTSYSYDTVVFVVVDEADQSRPIISLLADPNIIFKDDSSSRQNSTVTWNIQGDYVPSTCRASAFYKVEKLAWADSSWQSANFSSRTGSITTPNIQDITVYQLSCANSLGNVGTGIAIIGVDGGTYIPAPVVDLRVKERGSATVAQNSINLDDGSDITLEWTIQNQVTNCEFFGDWTNATSLTKDSTPTDQFNLVTTQSPYSYTMVCNGPGGFSEPDTATVVVGGGGSTGPVCGDGIKNGTEACDGTDLGGAVCPVGLLGAPVCRANCTISYNGCFLPPSAVCGNGVVEGTEACDKGGANGNGTSGCSSSCQIETNTTPICNKNNICERSRGENFFNCSDCRGFLKEF